MARYTYRPERRYSYSLATTTSGAPPTPTTGTGGIQIPPEITDAISTIDSYIPTDVFGIPTEYVLLGAGVTMFLLPMGKFKGIARIGGAASIALGGIRLASQYLLGADDTAADVTYTQPWDHQYYSEMRQPV